MNKFSVRTIFSLFTAAIAMSSCQAIGDIFKAGVWFGVLGVVVIVIIIFWLINKAGKK